MKTHDHNAERSVISSIMVDQKLSYYVDLIKKEWFFDAKHQSIVEAMKALRHDEKGIDSVTVVSAMKGDVGENFDTVNELTSGYVTGARIDEHLKIIRELYHVRELRKKCQHVVYRIDTSDETPLEIVADSAREISDVSKGAISSRTEHSEVGIIELCEDIISGAKPKGLVKTGFSKIDNVFGGLWPEMTILGARPGMGKTAFALFLSRAVANHSNALYISLEESKLSLQQRLLAMETGVSVQGIRRRDIGTIVPELMRDGAQRIRESNLYIHHEPGIGADEIGAICKRFQAERELGLVVIDHMDRIKGKNSELSGREETSKRLADIIGLGGYPGLVLHQLNKQCESRDDRRPKNGDLRYVGEADARAIWFLYREFVYSETADPHKLEVIVGKNNNGPCGTMLLHCDLETMRFREWT